MLEGSDIWIHARTRHPYLSPYNMAGGAGGVTQKYHCVHKMLTMSWFKAFSIALLTATSGKRDRTQELFFQLAKTGNKALTARKKGHGKKRKGKGQEDCSEFIFSCFPRIFRLSILF